MNEHAPRAGGASNNSDSIDPALFRRQALDAATSRYGAPIRPTGLAGWALTVFMVALFASLMVFLAVGRYSRKETVIGVLQPTAGAARVITMGAGVITQVYVTEGQLVSVGDPILELSTDRSVAGGREAPAALSDLMEESADREAVAITKQARARAEGNARKIEDLLARREALQEDQAQLAVSLDMQNNRVRLAQETLNAGQALHERQLFSTLQLRQREEALIAAQQGVGSIQREIRRNHALLRQMQAEQGRLEAESAQALAEAAATQAQFDQRQVQRRAERATVLVAGKAGQVVALQARPGTPVHSGRALAIILPPGTTLQAELWVPSRAAGFLRVGDQVRLMYDAFPYQKFGVGRGTVASVAGAPTEPADITGPIDANEALYRVLVNINAGSVEGYGRLWQLAPGMRLSADLVLDDRSLWEWLFDPIIAARRRSAA